MEEVLSCKNIKFKYREKSKENIVDDFSYSFQKGEIYLLTGFSGCGKSTLAYILSGLYPENKGIMTEGVVSLFGKDIEKYPPEERTPLIMMMFQNADTQFCMDRVKDEIIFCLENLAFPVEMMDKKVDSVLEETGIFHLKDRNIATLSGGEKQKLALACILAVSPKILVLDEPFANVDYESSQEIVEILKKLNREKKITIIAVDHRISLWEGIEHQLITLGKGCSILNKDLNSFLADDNGEEIYRNNRKTIKEKFDSKEEAVKFENLRVKYDKNILLEDVSFSIKQGSIVSIIGKSGSGKTSLLKMAAGIIKCDSGTIKIFGKDIKKMREKEFTANVGIVFQNPQNQFLTYKVIDELMFTLKRSFPKEEENKLIERADELLKEFDLYRYKHFSPFSLSQGQQRKLAVLSMLAANQKIILCDEPTYGQDNHTSIEIMEFLKRRADKGLTVIMVSHDRNLVFKYSDFVYEVVEKRLKEVEL